MAQRVGAVLLLSIPNAENSAPYQLIASRVPFPVSALAISTVSGSSARSRQ